MACSYCLVVIGVVSGAWTVTFAVWVLGVFIGVAGSRTRRLLTSM
jgi:hypothetical protein